MTGLNFKIENRIAFLEFNQPGSQVNVLDIESMLELERIIDKLSGVKAFIITSGKEGTFIAGADVYELERISSIEEAEKLAKLGKGIFNKLSGLDVVTVAVINGVCMGGGLELALACKYRVASLSDKVKIGFPECNLGIIPGWGGTLVLPKIIGLGRALDMIISGEIVSGKTALEYGIVDRLFPDESIVGDTIKFIINRKYKKNILRIFFEDTALCRGIIFNRAENKIIKKSKGFHPPALKAIEVIKDSYGGDIEAGFLAETVAFSELVITDASKNLMRVFFLRGKYKKYPWVGENIRPCAINKCGIVGAGVMGIGIAQVLSYNDIPVIIKDINTTALKSAIKAIKEIFKYAVRKKKIDKSHVGGKLKLISFTLTYKGFEDTDLVIETAAEDLNIKQRIFKDLEKVAPQGAVFASNTSSFSIQKIADVIDSPERLVGLHFFNPVHRMGLVEVVKSDNTSDEVLAVVIEFARRIGKIPIVVKDVPGFLINRILLPYMNEAVFLIEEGVRIDQIDRIVREFGMPMGPIELIDEIGIDIAYNVLKVLEGAYGSRMKMSPLLEKIRENGLLGKKSKRGFYLHNGKKRIPNPEIYNIIESSEKPAVSEETALKRMIYIMVNEAVRCLEEKVVDSPEAIDIGMIMGTGFPGFRGGLLRYAEKVGIDVIVKELRELEKISGRECFRPCGYLVEGGG